jgi:hypothetical protein
MAASTRVPHLSVDERQAWGKEARNQAPVSTHTGWMPATDRPDPVALLEEHAWQTPGRHPRDTLHDDLAPGDLGTMHGHDRHHGHARVGQDHGGLVGLERHRLQGWG